jgi:hypothetical protein
MEDIRGECKYLVEKLEGTRTPGRLRHRWDDNNKMDLQVAAWRGMDWLDLAQDRENWWALVNVMYLQVPQNVRNFMTD